MRFAEGSSSSSRRLTVLDVLALGAQRSFRNHHVVRQIDPLHIFFTREHKRQGAMSGLIAGKEPRRGEGGFRRQRVRTSSQVDPVLRTWRELSFNPVKARGGGVDFVLFRTRGLIMDPRSQLACLGDSAGYSLKNLLRLGLGRRLSTRP